MILIYPKVRKKHLVTLFITSIKKSFIRRISLQIKFISFNPEKSKFQRK